MKFYEISPLINRDFSEIIDLENKRDEEGIERLHPPMYHIVRLKRHLTQKEDAKCYQFFIPTRNTLASLTNIYKASRFPKLVMMCLIS
jgi:hypothetical protein